MKRLKSILSCLGVAMLCTLSEAQLLLSAKTLQCKGNRIYYGSEPLPEFVYCVDVNDGDTITVKTDWSKNPIKIRLADIDAPELKQEFGEDARELLQEQCIDRYLLVEFAGKDLYGRHLAKVWTHWEHVGPYTGGQTAQEFMVGNGMAWVYPRCKDRTLLGLQSMMRDGKHGLWSGTPVAPWDWRKRLRAPAPARQITHDSHQVDS